MRRAGVVLCALMLGGCSIAAKIDARTEYQKTVADYRACLDAHPWELKACDGKRLGMGGSCRFLNQPIRPTRSYKWESFSSALANTVGPLVASHARAELGSF